MALLKAQKGTETEWQLEYESCVAAVRTVCKQRSVCTQQL